MSLSKDRMQSLREAAVELAKDWPAEKRKLFIEDFLRAVVPMEENIDERLIELDLELTSLIEDVMPYKPISGAHMVEHHLGTLRKIAGLSINSLLAIRPPVVRLEVLDTFSDIITIARKNIVDADLAALERDGDQA